MPLEVQSKEKDLNPTQEYVSAGVLSDFYGFSLNRMSSQTLFSTNDAILMCHGYETYEEMMLDPKVSKDVNTLKIACLADGLSLIPAVSEASKDYNKAIKTEQLCNLALKNLDRPIKQILEEMLDALIYGHKIAEVTYEIKEVAGFDGFNLLPKYIKPKAFGVARFIVDQNFNVIGIGGALNNGKSASNEQGLDKISKEKIKETSKGYLIDVNGDEFLFLNKEKFMILTLRSRNADPRGTSFLKAAHKPWYLKEQIYPEYLRYLLICAIPLLVGFTPENETIGSDILKDKDGNPILDGGGQMIRWNPVTALRGALVEARNATALALKGGSKIQEVGNQGNNGVAFYKAIEIFNEEIESAILLQTLATSESRFNTRAASQTHMTLLDQIIAYLKDELATMLTSQLFKVIVRYNLGEDYLEFIPKVSFGDTERRNFQADGTTVATLFSAGYMTKGQLRATDAMLGLPEREDGDELINPNVNSDPANQAKPNQNKNLAR